MKNNLLMALALTLGSVTAQAAPVEIDPNVESTAVATESVSAPINVSVSPVEAAIPTAEATATSDVSLSSDAALSGETSTEATATTGTSELAAPDTKVSTDSSNTTFAGTTEPNTPISIVTVLLNGEEKSLGTPIGNTVSNEKGDFTLTVPTLERGTDYYVIATNSANQTSPESIVSVPTKLQTFSTSVDDGMKKAFGWFVNGVFYPVSIGGVDFPLIAGWLLLAALIFTVYFGFIQFRHIGLSLDIVRGKYTNPNEKEEGEVSHFQALVTALSGTVGLGNIAGVGAALAIGGPGATFWMIVVGLFGMASKFVECTLGVKYRTVLPSGAVSGGPMYYLSRGMAERGMGGFGKVLAVGFALMCLLGSFGGGNMFQGNQAFDIISSTFEIPDQYGFVFGLILAVLVGMVIIGGMPRIASVTEKVVPFMAALYIIMSLIVILANLGQVIPAFVAIFEGAFTGIGVVGGFIGALIQGLKRATFSNEAGIGSAAIAHSAVKTKEPATEGLVALLEPFIDTVVICTMTALVITISGMNTVENIALAGAQAAGEKVEGVISGVELTRLAFMETAPFFQYFLTLAVVLFAFSTMISWSYYGLKAWTYLFGEGKTTEMVYKLIFCIFVVIGATIEFGFVIAFSDAAIFAMSLFNIIGLYFLMPVVKREIESYIARVKSGEIKKFK